MKLIILLSIIIIIILLLIYQKKSNLNISMPIKISTVYELERQSRPLYKQVKLKNLFKKYPEKIKGLRFGYICPGAMKTIDYLNTYLFLLLVLD